MVYEQKNGEYFIIKTSRTGFKYKITIPERVFRNPRLYKYDDCYSVLVTHPEAQGLIKDSKPTGVEVD